MFENILSAFGVNDVSVKTKVKQKDIQVGERLDGIILIEGCETEETIHKIKIELVEKIENTDETSDFNQLDNIISTYEIEDVYDIPPNESLEKDFSVQFDSDSLKNKPNKITLRTHLYLSNAVDNYDEVELDVHY